MKVTVLYGGPSVEREISLLSGQAVIAGLKSMGHEVFGSDVAPDNLFGLDHAADVIFPVLHGHFGESGELQEILEARRLSFVGSGSAASRLGMNKVATKRAWEAAGLPTPPWQLLDRDKYRPENLEQVPVPCVVKAVSSGSSIDVYLCRSRADAHMAIRSVLSKHGEALIERLIDGPELTVGLLEEKPLAPLRIVSTRAFFDYEAKYKSGDTKHLFDTGLPAEVVAKSQELARRANEVVGGRDLARVDIMLDESHNPYLLEINTLPGFTSKSLLPEAALNAGIEFGPLVDRLVRRAAARGPIAPV